MASAVAIGTTGLVGGNILSTLISHPAFTTVTSITRRAPAPTGAKLNTVTEKDSSKWASSLTSIQPPPSIFFSALGTTRADAGGLEQQRKIDYDLNLEMATAAKKAGAKVCVLISSSGANAQSWAPYMKMKGELEETVKGLGFEKTVIVRPGVILGSREKSRPFEAPMRWLGSGLGMVTPKLTDFWGQDAEVIARSAVSAGLKALNGEGASVQELGMADIVRLGRTEWKEPAQVTQYGQ